MASILSRHYHESTSTKTGVKMLSEW